MNILGQASHSQEGDLRPFNEDAILAPSPGLWMLADGMGSAAASENAGSRALGLVASSLTQNPSGGILSALAKAHATFSSVAGAEEGAALVVAQVNGNFVDVLWIGDCRAYALLTGQLEALTKDHTQVQAWVDEGLIDADRVSTHPYRNVLTQALGIEQSSPLEVGHRRLEVKAPLRLLLCSDGLSDFLSPAEIQDALSTGTCEEAARGLVGAALTAGSGDDLSLIVIDLGP